MSEEPTWQACLARCEVDPNCAMVQYSEGGGWCFPKSRSVDPDRYVYHDYHMILKYCDEGRVCHESTDMVRHFYL